MNSFGSTQQNGWWKGLFKEIFCKSSVKGNGSHCFPEGTKKACVEFPHCPKPPRVLVMPESDTGWTGRVLLEDPPWMILILWSWCLVPPPEASYWSQVVVWWHKPLMIIQQCQERRTRRRWTLCGSPTVQNGRARRQPGLGSVWDHLNSTTTIWIHNWGILPFHNNRDNRNSTEKVMNN